MLIIVGFNPTNYRGKEPFQMQKKRTIRESANDDCTNWSQIGFGTLLIYLITWRPQRLAI